MDLLFAVDFGKGRKENTRKISSFLPQNIGTRERFFFMKRTHIARVLESKVDTQRWREREGEEKYIKSNGTDIFPLALSLSLSLLVLLLLIPFRSFLFPRMLLVDEFAFLSPRNEKRIYAILKPLSKRHRGFLIFLSHHFSASSLVVRSNLLPLSFLRFTLCFARRCFSRCAEAQPASILIHM